MTSARTRRTAAASLTLFAALGLAACGTGVDTAVNQQYQAAVGADDRTGEVEVLNALVVADEESEQAAQDPAGVISASLVNNSDESVTLTGVSATTLDGETVDVTGGDEVEIAPLQLVRLGVDDATAITVAPVEAGLYVTLTFELEGAESVTIETPVVARTEDGTYDEVVTSAGEGGGLDTQNPGDSDDAQREDTDDRE